MLLAGRSIFYTNPELRRTRTKNLTVERNIESDDVSNFRREVPVVRRREVISLKLILERRFVGRHGIIPIGPRAEVNQLTAFGTERTMRIIFPLDGFIAGRAFHKKNCQPSAISKALIKLRASAELTRKS